MFKRKGMIFSKKIRFYFLVGFITIFIFFLTINQRRDSYLENRLPPMITNFLKGTDASENATMIEIFEVLEMQRKIIEKEMANYEYQNGKYGINVSKLQDLVMESGGRPLRSVILTSWRSGSTFLGDVINAHPANFYHYEPLLDFGIVQVRESPMADEAVYNLENMFNCDYCNLDHYLEYGKTHPWVFNHNTHLWRQCLAHKSICWNPKFVSRFCKLFPFQSMKIVRLRLKLAERFLSQKELGVRLLLLARDPRGILQSRKHREWCPGEPDCSDPALLCSDMVSDFKAAVKFLKKYPDTFKVIRYEDLSVEAYEGAREIYKFFGLNFHENVQEFLDTHTKTDVGGASSTFRNSKAAPFHWRTDLDFDEVQEIQDSCEQAMKLWGYTMAHNASHQKVFNPITNFSLTSL